jgi:hypothetical protein
MAAVTTEAVGATEANPQVPINSLSAPAPSTAAINAAIQAAVGPSSKGKGQGKGKGRPCLSCSPNYAPCVSCCSTVNPPNTCTKTTKAPGSKKPSDCVDLGT